MWEITEHANNYMQRELSLESDIYNAFLGIERKLSRGRRGFTFHYGLPTRIGLFEGDGLLWPIENMFCNKGRVRNSDAARRRCAPS
jgi:hypothetical protein